MAGLDLRSLALALLRDHLSVLTAPTAQYSFNRLALLKFSRYDKKYVLNTRRGRV